MVEGYAAYAVEDRKLFQGLTPDLVKGLDFRYHHTHIFQNQEP